MATSKEVDRIIDESYIDIEKENDLSILKEDTLNVEFEIKTILQKNEEENKKSKRWSWEVKIFFMLRDYLKVLDSCAITPQYQLNIVALAYRKTKTHFEITIYSADKWQHYFVSGISNILVEKWINEVGEEAFIDCNEIKIIKSRLYITTFLIPSEHTEDGLIEFFYNNIYFFF